MKKIKIFSLLALAAFAAVSFNACKGDDGGDESNDSESAVFTDGDVQYKMSLSELKDDESQLSFSQTIEYIKPIELKEDITFTFKYKADSVPADDSAANQSVEKKDLPIVEASMVIDCGSEANAQMVRDSILVDSVSTASYDITIDGSKVVCNYKNEVIANMTYAVAEGIYNELAKKIGDQKKKNNADKAKQDTEARKEEAENNRKTNYSFRDSVGEIISTDSTISFTLVKDSVAAIYSYKYDKNNGMITSGTVVCVCKNSNLSKSYAKKHMMDKNASGQLIYKSINLDGCNVTFVYSDSAIMGLTKDAVILAQKDGKKPDVESVQGSAGNNNNEENNGENTENKPNENGNNQNSENQENKPNENNNSQNNTKVNNEENVNVKPGEKENNNEELTPIPVLENQKEGNGNTPDNSEEVVQNDSLIENNILNGVCWKGKIQE